MKLVWVWWIGLIVGLVEWAWWFEVGEDGRAKLMLI